MITDFRMQVFLTVLDTLSFTRSSSLLSITQPAVTKHIKELERQLGCALFLRRGSSIEPTSEALRLKAFAERVIDSYLALNQAFTSNNDSMQGSLNLGASTTIAQYLLPKILSNFKQHYPNIKITLRGDNSQEINNKIIARKLDFGMVEDNQTHPSLHYQPFLSDKIVLVCDQKLKTSTKKVISKEELLTLPLVIREFGSGTLEVIEHHLNKQHINLRELNIEIQLGSSESIIRYLLNSKCYAFISETAVSEYLENKKLKVINVKNLNIERKFRFVSLHSNMSQQAQYFQDFCLSNYNYKL